jgi:uncharacterized protein
MRRLLGQLGHDGAMSLKDQIKHDQTEAMRGRDQLTLSTLRMVGAAIQYAEVAGTEAVELTDDQVLDVLRSEAKKRVEAADLFEQAGRTESAAKERAELAVIQAYLPAAMSDDDLSAIVADEVAKAASSGAVGPKAMGGVIKAVRDRVGPLADGQRIAAAVKGAL